MYCSDLGIYFTHSDDSAALRLSGNDSVVLGDYVHYNDEPTIRVS